MSRRDPLRVLMAWELGANLGHVAPLLAVARALRERGATVVFALRDLGNADLLARSGFAFLPAPVQRRTRARPAYRSYADMLEGEAFPSAKAAFVGALAWRAIFRAVRPEVLVADHAPVALLAARGTSLRTVLSGTPFSVPPAVGPLPRFTTGVGDEARRETKLLARLNSVLSVLRGPALAAASDLYRADAIAIRWLPELDFFAPRAPENYAGPLTGDAGDAEPAWPQGKGPKLLVYLRAKDRLAHLLEAARHCDASVLAYVPGADAAAQPRGSHISASPLKMSALLAQCDALVSHGGNLCAAAALAGKPQLLFPLHVEQNFIARQAAGAGVAAVASVKAGVKVLAAQVAALAPGTALNRAAGEFAARQDPELRSGLERTLRQIGGARSSAPRMQTT